MKKQILFLVFWALCTHSALAQLDKHETNIAKLLEAEVADAVKIAPADGIRKYWIMDEHTFSIISEPDGT